jgi:serine/threonine-protein kinase
MQRRVRLYLGFLLVLFGTSFVIDAGDLWLAVGRAALLSEGILATFALLALFLGFWGALRRVTASTGASTTIEVVTTLSIAGMAIPVLDSIPDDQVGAGPLVAVMLVMVARAAIVPSPGRRTLVVGALVTALVGAGYRAHPHGEFAVFALVWLTAFTIASAFVSRVIYGLQEQLQRSHQIGQYVLEEQLGEGGMGVVYRARHQLLRRPTAIKLMSASRSSERDVARFEHEVRQTARLSHPNTVTIYDYGRSSEGVFYYAMELLLGATLDDVVALTGALPPARVARILAAVAGALAESHGISLIHRDIKPANVMLCEQGGEVDVVKVLDFGLVKDLSSSAELTHDGSLTGTPLFMSPEAIRDPRNVGPSSDLYAIGALGYFLVTGQLVFDGRTTVEVCSQHLMSAPIPPSERLGRSVPEGLEATILACLAKQPEARPPSAMALRERLLGLSDLGQWSEADARRWWDEHRQALGERRTRSGELSATLAVDLSGRS